VSAATNNGNRTGGPKLLIISPDPQLLSKLEENLAAIKRPGSAAILRGYPSAEQMKQIVQAEHPAAVILGLSEREIALDLIAHLRATHPQIVVAAAHVASESDLMLAALRAGARDYLGPPFLAQALEQLLLLPDAGTDGLAGRLLCFQPARGGCGCTTVALHVAAAIARQAAARVLFIDFDFHAGTVDLRLNLQPRFTLADAVARAADLGELWGQITCSWGGFEVLAPPSISRGLNSELLRDTGMVFASAKGAYPWVICDLPPSLHSSSMDALGQAETVYLVCTPEVSALQLAGRRARELREVGIPGDILRLVLNRAGSRSPLKTDEVARAVGLPLACSLENDYNRVNQAVLEGGLVPESCKLGQQFAAFARQITGLPAPAVSAGASQLKSILSRLGGSLLSPPSRLPAKRGQQLPEKARA